MTEHKLAHILRAIADGKSVQIRCKSYNLYKQMVEEGPWRDLDTQDAFSIFVTNPNMEYRIKPNPLVKKWRWVVKDKSTGKLVLTSLHYSSEEEYNLHANGYVAVQLIKSTMIEVEEDDV